MAFQPAPYPVPVWKRKHNMPKVTLKRGASDERNFTNAMGTAVTADLCKAVLKNENPKNLIDAIKRNNPQPTDTRKSVDDFYDDGRARPEYLKRRVHECFPEGAISNKLLRKAIVSSLNEEGFNYANTLLVTCRDRMDPCRLFEKEDWAFPTESYELGGLGSLPFTGRAGLEAALQRVPDGGCLLIEYCSHTGFDYEGTLGRVVRYDRRAGMFAPPIRTLREPLECYESLVGQPDRKTFAGDEIDKEYEFNEGGNRSQVSENNAENDDNDKIKAVGEQKEGVNSSSSSSNNTPSPGVNEAALAAALAVARRRVTKEDGITYNSEFDGMFELMKKRFNDVSSANTIHHYMATMLQKIARQMFLDVLDTTPLGKNVTCILLGGIQLELPDPLEPYFSLLTLETRTAKGRMNDFQAKVKFHLNRSEQQIHVNK
jgi:hypothetical protein